MRDTDHPFGIIKAKFTLKRKQSKNGQNDRDKSINRQLERI